MSTTTKSLAGINSLLGLWLIAAPFVLKAPTTDLWNDVIVGAVIVFLAGSNYYQEREQQPMSTGKAGLTLLFGVWLIFAPFVFDIKGALLWNDVIVGILITSFAGYNAYIASRTGHPRATAEQPIE